MTWTSSLVTTGFISGSHVFVLTYTLGWDDGTSLTLDFKGMVYDCYAKCGKAPSCPNAPTSQISCSTPINAPWHP